MPVFLKLTHTIRKVLRVARLSRLAILSLTAVIFSGCANINLISAVGSSSVQPLLSKLSSHYVLNHNDKDNLVEISVQAGGSSAGVKAITKGLADIGNVSKNTKSYAEENKQLWMDKKLKTITLGKDAIAVIYKAPSEFKGKLVLTKDNLNDLYDLFAGSKSVDINKFVENGQTTKNSNHNLIGFPRTGGAFASGTAEAFLKFSGLTQTKTLDKDSKEILEGQRNYGPNARPTSETNIEAFNTFVTTLRQPNLYGMVYLSLGFVNNNMNLIKSEGFEVLKVKYDNNAVTPSSQAVSSNTYKWVRPLNSVVSLLPKQKTLPSIQRFFNWLLFSNNSEIKKIYDDFGVLELTADEKKKMFKTGNAEMSNIANFWVDDYSLNNQTFGAL